MLKALEAHNPGSCWNKAEPSERVFVLLERDASAPAAIRAWCEDRIKRYLNTPNDAQIREALDCALEMEKTNGKGIKDLAERLNKARGK